MAIDWEELRKKAQKQIDSERGSASVKEVLPRANKTNKEQITVNLTPNNKVLEIATKRQEEYKKELEKQKAERKQREQETYENTQKLKKEYQESQKWLMKHSDQNNTVLGKTTQEYINKSNEMLSQGEAYAKAMETYEKEYAEEYKNRMKESNAKSMAEFPETVKKVGLTVADAGFNAIQGGITDVSESIADAGTYGVAQILDVVGNDEEAERLRKNAQVNIMRDKVFGNANNYLAENSYLGDTGRSVAQGIGQSTTLGLLTPIPGASTGVLAASALGSGLNEAFSTEGISDAKAWTKAGLSTGLEVAVERLFGLLGYGGTSFEDIIMNSTEKISNGLAKAIVQTGITATGEGVEEMLSYAGNYLIDHGLDLVDENGKLSKEWDNEELWQNFFVGALSSGIAQGAVNSYNYIRDRKNNNLINSAITAQNEVLPTANNQNDIITDNENILTEKNDLNNVLNMSENEILPTVEQNNTLNTNNTQTELSNMLKNKESQQYQYIISNNTKVNALNESASKYFNNSEESKGYLSALAKVIKDKNIEIKFDGNLQTPDGRIARGSYSNGVITINPYSNSVGEFVAIHEITHAIGTQNMIKMLDKFKNSNFEFNNEMKALLENYSSTEINEEALADVSAQLFGTQEFINNVANAQPSLFQKIYSEIKYLWHQFRGYKNQNQFINDLYFKWTQAYNSSNEVNEKAGYSIAGQKGMKNILANNKYDGLLLQKMLSERLQQNGIDNETIRKATNWYQDKNGDWKFEISDKDMYLKDIKFQENKTYKLGDILKHDILFNAYPELSDYNVEFKKIKSQGVLYKDNKKIVVNSNKLNNKKNISGTLIHEIQHAIQNIENFENGMNSSISKKAYYESLGEIEASDTKKRYILEKNRKIR